MLRAILGVHFIQKSSDSHSFGSLPPCYILDIYSWIRSALAHEHLLHVVLCVYYSVHSNF